MKNNVIKKYSRIMNQVDLSDEAKQRIAKNCARYATLQKIKSRKYTVTAVVKENTTDRI